MTTSAIAPSAFAVWWKDLERWVIPSSLIMRQSLPRDGNLFEWERL